MMLRRVKITLLLPTTHRQMHINSAKTTILHSPVDYLNTILSHVASSKQNITLSALYCGTGDPERRIIEEIDKVMFIETKLTCTFILDYSRASRIESKNPESSSIEFLKPLLKKYEKRMKLLLYKMPQPLGVFNSFIPLQIAEIMGVYHCKFCLFDENVILTGANLSDEYLSNRQDRYMLISQNNSDSKNSKQLKLESQTRTQFTDLNLPNFLRTFVTTINPFCCHVEYILKNDRDTVIIHHPKKGYNHHKGDLGAELKTIQSQFAQSLPLLQPTSTVNNTYNTNNSGSTKSTVSKNISERMDKTASKINNEYSSYNSNSSIIAGSRENEENTNKDIDNCSKNKDNSTENNRKYIGESIGENVESNIEKNTENYREINRENSLESTSTSSMTVVIQHYPCGVTDETDTLLPLLFTNFHNNSHSNFYRNKSLYMASTLLQSSLSMQVNTDISHSKINHNNLTTNPIINPTHNFIYNGQNSIYHSSNSDNILSQKIVISSPYPSFLESFVMSLFSLSSGAVKISIDNSNSDNLNDKISPNNTDSTTNNNQFNDSNINSSKSNSEFTNKSNKKLYNNNNSNNNNIINMNIIIPSTSAHGFSKGKGVKTWIPKMHSQALKDVLGILNNSVGYKINNRINDNTNDNNSDKTSSEINEKIKNNNENYLDNKNNNNDYSNSNNNNNKINISISPYDRQGWTFHSKGIWLFSSYSPGTMSIKSNGISKSDKNNNNIYDNIHNGKYINVFNNYTCNNDNNRDKVHNKTSDKIIDSNENNKHDNRIHNSKPTNNHTTTATYIGSSNLGERSSYRDFELGFVIHTNCPSLSNQLHEECSRLEENSSELSVGMDEYILNKNEKTDKNKENRQDKESSNRNNRESNRKFYKKNEKNNDWQIPFATKILRTFL